MAALRRHLFAVTWTILSVHILCAAVGATAACLDGQHTHSGEAAPDCPMHHGTPTNAPIESHHSHHGDASAFDGAGAATERLSCRCAGDVPMIFLGQPALFQWPASSTPVIEAVVLDVVSETLITDPLFSPPSPPPR
jgi:hypothetical protein